MLTTFAAVVRTVRRLVLPARLCQHQWTHIGFGAVEGNLLAAHRFQCLRCGLTANIIRDGQNASGEGRGASPRTSPPPCSASDVQGKYNELLYAVARKFSGESRHETALRYIREREAAAQCDCGSCKQNNTALLRQATKENA